MAAGRETTADSAEPEGAKKFVKIFSAANKAATTAKTETHSATRYFKRTIWALNLEGYRIAAGL